MVGFDDLLPLVKREYSSQSHLYKGRNVGMQAATTPNKTSQVRQYQFGMLSPWSSVSKTLYLPDLPLADSHK